MAKLCIYIPPFAADYAGVCSVFFDFDCLTAINDASCCTSHYVRYDEPRWSENKKSTFCTSLRNIDAILGNDDKVVKRICEASEHLDSYMIALVGTPVPALTGMDMEGIAYEIESSTGKPSFGFNTTGFDYYDKGIVLAGKSLFDRFAQEEVELIPHSLNILGVTPLDFGAVGNDISFCDYFYKSGWTVNGSYFMGTSLDQIKNVAAAEINLAVTASGLQLAKYLQSRFGTPYIAACPTGFRHGNYLLKHMDAGRALPIHSITEKSSVLIVADQVIGNSIRDALRVHGCLAGITVATFFSWSATIAERGDMALSSEKQLVELVRSRNYTTLIGDPYLWRFPGCEELRQVPVAHPAVSSRLTWNTVSKWLSSAFDSLLANVVSAVNEEFKQL